MHSVSTLGATTGDESVTMEAIAALIEASKIETMDAMEAFKSETMDAMAGILKTLDRLDQRTGILVEEKARNKARIMFGENFSKRLLIKSLYEVIRHIAKADHEMIPAEYGDGKIDAAVEKVARIAQQHAGTFVKSAFSNLSAITKDNAFKHEEFNKWKQNLSNLGVELFGENPNLEDICGRMIGIARKLGEESCIGEEKEEDRKRRVKITSKRFERKLKRLKVGLQKLEDGEKFQNFKNCSGPGIMICCELSQIPDDSQPFANKTQSNIRDISEWKEEVECDIRGSVSLHKNTATISTGEIKSSVNSCGPAVKQISLRLALIEYILQRVFEEDENNEKKICYTNVIKKGHVFVLENDDNRQQGGKHDGDVSIFYHSTDVGEV